MAASRKRAKLQPELLSTHAAAPAGDLSGIVIRARSRAKAATPVIDIAERLPATDRGPAAEGDPGTHSHDGLLFRKGAATGASFRPDYWTFDRPDQKQEIPEGPLLAKRGTAPTPPKPAPRAKPQPTARELQEQIEALQVLIGKIGPEEDAAEPPAAANPDEPPPPASLLQALQPGPPDAPAAEAVPPAEIPASPAPEPAAVLEVMPEAAASVEPGIEAVPDAMTQPEPVAEIAPPEPYAPPEASVAFAAIEIPPEPAAETPAPEVPTETIALVAPPPAMAEEAPAEIVPEPIASPAGASAELTEEVAEVSEAAPLPTLLSEPTQTAEPPAPSIEIVTPAESVVALPMISAAPEPAAVVEPASITPAQTEPPRETAATALAGEPACEIAPLEETPPPELAVEVEVPAAGPARELPTVKPAGAPAIALRLPEPPAEAPAVAEPVTAAEAPRPAAGSAPAETMAEPAAKPEPPAPWRDELAELKTMLSELRERALAPIVVSINPAQMQAPAGPAAPAPSLLEQFPEPEELPRLLLETQEPPPDAPHEPPPIEPMEPTVPPVAAAPVVAEPEPPPPVEQQTAEMAAVADSLDDLIHDVLSRKSFSIATVAAMQSRTGAYEPPAETPDPALDAVPAPVRAAAPIEIKPAAAVEPPPPRRGLSPVDRVLAVITAVMLVLGGYFGLALWRNGMHGGLQMHAIALPPVEERDAPPIWATHPDASAYAPVGSTGGSAQAAGSRRASGR